MSVSIQELTKAIASLEEALQLYSNGKPDSIETKAFRDACISRFEFNVDGEKLLL